MSTSGFAAPAGAGRPSTSGAAMFRLQPTDAAWGRRAVAHLDEILLEQAHLEKKAASAAIQLLFRYPHEPSIQRPLSEVAREELEHFETILGHLARRGVPFGPQKASPYAAALLVVVRGEEPQRMLDSLLCSAIIEARSCERMRLLAAALPATERELIAMYDDLVTCEARHHGLYLGLARDILPRTEVDARLVDLIAHEAEVSRQLPSLPRLHC